WKDRDCWIVRFEVQTGAKPKIAIWIAPDMDYSVVRIEARNELDSGARVTTVESVLQRYGEEGIWYPKTCVVEQLVKNAVTTRDTIKVTEATLNGSIPEEVFRMSGMNIPPGTVIHGSAIPNARAHIW